ncbi:MAG: dihydrofolate reductase [Microbacteriaceae bacterium]
MTIGLIWAQTRDGVIGRDGTMPWHVPEDLAHFRAVTGSGSVIMGRRTWDSLPPRFRPLPNRRNIVVTRQSDWHADGVVVTHSLESAISAAGADAWLIGGGELFAELIDTAAVLEVTELDATINGDTYAPQIAGDWIVRSRTPETGWATSREGMRYRFLRYER